MAQRKTLLIVDDDSDLRGALAEQLQAEEFTTVEAKPGPTSSCSTSICPT
jgi:DNA-binding NtrC family response regulator